MTDPNFDEALTRAVGRELRCVRNAQGLSRAELVSSAKFTLTVNSYSFIELGTLRPSLTRFVQLADTLRVPAPRLLEGALARIEGRKG